MASEAHIHSFEDLMEKVAAISTFAPVFERISYYLDRNIQNVPFITANELALNVGVSQGSISRYCSMLGYRGFKDFQYALRTFLQNRTEGFSHEDYLSNLNIDDIISSEQNNLNELKNVFANVAYQEMLEQISSAHRIFLISSRISGTLLHYFAYNLKRIGKDVSIINEADLFWEASDLFCGESVLFFTAMFPRYSHSLIFKLERLKKCGAPVVGITDSNVSPLNALANLSICLPVTHQVPFGIYSVPMLFLGILAQDLASISEKSNTFIKALRKVEEESYVYHNAKKMKKA